MHHWNTLNYPHYPILDALAIAQITTMIPTMTMTQMTAETFPIIWDLT